MTKISIVIPVYNGELNIEETITSLKVQEDYIHEIIIVNDGSVDNTREILRKYESDMVKVYDQENKGVSSARNNGMSFVTGDYVIFLDSDDSIDDGYLKRLNNKIASNQPDLIYTGYKIVTPGKTTKRNSRFSRSNVKLNYILDNINVQTGGWAIKAHTIKNNNIKFPEGVSWGEDVEFFLKVMTYANNIDYIKGHYINYNVGFGNEQLSNFDLEKVRSDFESIQRLVDDKEINNSEKIEDALLKFRLQALIIYRLNEAFTRNVDEHTILDTYNTYKRYIENNYWINGLRSLKLNLTKRTLKNRLKEIVNDID